MADTDRYETEHRVPIGDAARIAGVSISTIRRWEDEGKITAARTPGNQRRYRVSDVQRLLTEPAGGAA